MNALAEVFICKFFSSAISALLNTTRSPQHLFLNIPWSLSQDEAHRLIQEDCKKLNILRRKLSKPCNYADISPRPNEFHWAHSGRCYFSRFSAPKPASLENKRGPEPATFDSSGEEESFDEYKSGWRFLDVSEGAEERLDTLKLYTELKNIRRMLSKPCDYRKIAPASYNNEFHW